MKRISFLLLIITIFAFNNKAKSQLYSDTIDVLNYHIYLEITDFVGQNITGIANITITPKMNNVTHFTLYLQELNIDSILIDNNTITTFNYSDSLISIYPPTTLNIDDTILLRVAYHGQPVKDPSNWGGFYFGTDYAFNLGVGFEDNPHNYGRVWYPCLDDFIDKATYEFQIRVPVDLEAVCNGTLIDVICTGANTHQYHWKLNNEIPTYLASVAVGNYACVKDTFNGITGAIPIELWCRPQDSLNTIASYQNLKNILAIYENAYGPYLWERVGYVSVPFNSGAMEHATNIAMPQSTFDGTITYQSLAAHELSHHWFGDLVTCATAEDMWLNEGWAVFSESITKEGLYGYDAYRANLKSLLSEVLLKAHINDGGFYALYGIPHEITYGTTVYDKGALVVHTLRNYVSDTVFFRAVQRYMYENKFESVTTAEFLTKMNTYTGINLNDFFDAWVYTPGFPHFSIDSVVDKGNMDYSVHIRQKYRARNVLANSNKVFIRFYDSNLNYIDKQVEFSGRDGSAVFNLPFTPAFTVIDPLDMIADATVDADVKIKATGTYRPANTWMEVKVLNYTDSAYLRITHNWVDAEGWAPFPGIVLNKLRYWTINGILPANLDANASFKYNGSVMLDQDFLTQPKDSLLLLYRQDVSKPWQITSFSVSGSDFAGYLTTNLKLGEYVLAVYDNDHPMGVEQTDIINTDIKIYPNPNNGDFTIEYNDAKAKTLKIIDTNGKIIDVISLNNAGREEVKTNLKKGLYFFSIYDNNNRILMTEKFIISK